MFPILFLFWFGVFGVSADIHINSIERGVRQGREWSLGSMVRPVQFMKYISTNRGLADV